MALAFEPKAFRMAACIPSSWTWGPGVGETGGSGETGCRRIRTGTLVGRGCVGMDALWEGRNGIPLFLRNRLKR